MILPWLRSILNICKKQPDDQGQLPAAKTTHNNQKSRNDRNTQSATPRNDGVFYTAGIIGTGEVGNSAGSPHVGHHHGGGGGCGGGDHGGGSDGGHDGGGGGCGGGCGGCGGD